VASCLTELPPEPDDLQVQFVPAFFRKKFLEVTLSTGAIEVFFTTLSTALDGLTKALSNPFVKALFDAGAQIFAFISAVALLGSFASFAVKVVAGGLLRVAKAVNFLKGGAKGAGLAGLRASIGAVASAFGRGIRMKLWAWD